jgi:glycosyltransferase involved in cell wall biosynthesis
VKVLILHQHFKIPHHGGAIRSYYLAKALVEKGVETVVITAHNKPRYEKENIDGIEVHYLSVPYDNRFGFYRRLIAFFSFLVKSVKFAARHRDASLCYAISTPLTTGLAAMLMKRWYRIPFVFEVGDLWPDAPIMMGFIRSESVQRSLYRMETAIYKSAHSIVALSPAIRDLIQKKISGKTVHLLPNLSDTDFFMPEQKNPMLQIKYHVQGRFVVSYIGAMGVANGLNYVLECAVACQREKLPVHFLLCGNGAKLNDLKHSAARSSLRNLSFIPFQNRDGVGEVMNVTDATFICYQPVQILETGAPNKYFDGLAAGKLTIINFGGWIREEVEKEQCGVYVDPKLSEDFVKKLSPFLRDGALLKSYQLAARMLAEREYSRKKLGERFWEIIN